MGSQTSPCFQDVAEDHLWELRQRTALLVACQGSSQGCSSCFSGAECDLPPRRALAPGTKHLSSPINHALWSLGPSHVVNE